MDEHKLSAREAIAELGLEPHPEGGHFRETFRDRLANGNNPGGRAFSTAIYYLLAEGEVSRWHRVDAAEIWHWYAGAPLKMSISLDGRDVEQRRLGTDLARQERPQIVVPAMAWQSAVCLGSWTLVGCTVAPGFQFEGFELAHPGWEPGD